MTSLPAHFWDRVEKTDTCWLWTGVPTANGYGKTSWNGRIQYAHRLAWFLTHGPLDVNLVVDHKCHVKRCVNPDHLQVVTQSQNMQNRSGPQVNSRSGVRGVHRQGDRWRVQIRANGRNHSGGMYDDLEAAAVAASKLRASLMSNSIQDLSAAG